MKFTYRGHKNYIHYKLAGQLDNFVYNIGDDWDFTIVITGDRMVRVGKSVLAQCIAAYLAMRIEEYIKIKVNFGLDDIYFESKVMIEHARTKPKYSINIYDEGREGLASTKSLSTISKDIVDFFAECGQLNQIIIVVLPDFFGLNEEIAVARSEILLNVYRKNIKKMVNMYGTGKQPIVSFGRGEFEFFSRYNKSALYDKFKRTRTKYYRMQKHDFVGDFYNHYAVDEKKYRAKKLEALTRYKEKEDKPKFDKCAILRDNLIMEYSEKGLSSRKISNKLEKLYKYSIDRSQISRIIAENNQIMADV